MTAPARFRPVARVLLLAALFATPTWSAERAADAPADETARPAAPPSATDPPGVTSFAPTRRPAANRFAVRLRESAARHRQELSALRARIGAAGRAERAELQRQAEALKEAWQAELLGLQIERARGAGRAALAEKLERRRSALQSRDPRSAGASAGGVR